MKKKWTALQKKYRIMIIIALAVVVVGGGTLGAYAYSNHQAEQERQVYEQAVTDQRVQLDAQAEQLADLQKSVEALLEESYLKADITDEDIKALEDKLAGIKAIVVEDQFKADLQNQLNKPVGFKIEINELLKMIRTKFDAQAAVNALFEKPALVGTKTEKKPVITDKLDSKAVTAIKKKYYQEDSEDKWQQSINGLLDAAEKQLKEIDKLKAQLAKYLKDGKITDKVTPEVIADLHARLDKIQNKTVKTELLDEIVKIELLHDEKVRVEAEEKAKTAEAEAAAAAEKQENGSDETAAAGGGEAPQAAAPSGDSGTDTGYVDTWTDNSSDAAPAAPAEPAPAPELKPDPEPVYTEPVIETGWIGNAGLFSSDAEAYDYVNSKISAGWDYDNGYSGYELIDVFYTDGSWAVSVNWY